MRPQLFITGIMLIIVAILFYSLEIPFVFFWSIPFGISGLIMVIAAPFLKEAETRIKPPEGYRFCVYCSNTIPLESERCFYCNGKQPKE